MRYFSSFKIYIPSSCTHSASSNNNWWSVNLGTAKRVCEQIGIDLWGGDIKVIPLTTVQACKEECAKLEGCVAFTTAAGSYNKCWLKNGNHHAESRHSACISARMSCYEQGIKTYNKNMLRLWILGLV